ncbi:MAG TPA: thioredoxin domain-containing protein [Tepidiformaceae bacterium]|nr:thioredoxin domain-containing protein [Tepidiformaceae bacterium]
MALALMLVAAIVLAGAACSGGNGYSPTPTPAATTGAGQSPGASVTSAPASTKPDTQYVDALNAAASALPLDLAQGNKLGSDNAPLKMFTFVDFQCPYCLRFAATQEPTLISEYVKTGKLQIIAQMFPILGQESVLAAVAGQCAAAQDKFWQFYDHLYLVEAQAGQVSNEQRDVGRLSRDNLVKYATDLGMDPARFNTCFDDPATLSAVQDSVDNGHNFGITGTPGFVINNVSHGSGAPASLDAWRQILDAALRATPVASPTTAAANAAWARRSSDSAGPVGSATR